MKGLFFALLILGISAKSLERPVVDTRRELSRVGAKYTSSIRGSVVAAAAGAALGTVVDAATSSLTTTTAPVGNGSKVGVLADKLGDAVQSLRSSNWTLFIMDLRDPDTQPYISAVGMVISLIVCFYGHRSLLIWLSLLGFITFFLLVYVFGPILFETDLCCGPDKEKTLLAICGIAGAVGAIMAIWAYRVGLALAGGGAGLSIAMAVRPLLEAAHVLHAETDFIIACTLFSAVGAVCALLRPRPLVVLGTAVVGAFGFAVGVGSFEHCHFIETVVLVRETYTHGGPGPLPTCDVALLAVWGAMSVLGVVVQYGLVRLCARHGKLSGDGADPLAPPASSSSTSTARSSSSSSLPAAAPTRPPARSRPTLETIAEGPAGSEHAPRSVRRYIRRRIAEVLAEARRLRLRLTDTSDSDSDSPHPRHTHGNGYQKLRTSTTGSDGSSEGDEPAPPLPLLPPRRGRVAVTPV